MISRRRILSRSRDQLNFGEQFDPYEDEEDIWYNKDKLFKDHIQEILNKWDQIDDEIWGKIICMERNRRVAKAYARAPILTINGCDNGFDGYRIGLNGFDNPMRDVKTEEVKRSIGLGVKVKMDQDGNIMIKRISKANVFVKGWSDVESSDDSGDGYTSTLSSDLIKASGLLEPQKSVKLFDMKKFQSMIHRELRCAYPDRRKLESQCICCVAFVKDAQDILDIPTWVMIINIVALDMLKTKLPPIDNRKPNALMSVFERPSNKNRLYADEDPYSLPGSGGTSSSSGASGTGNGSGGSNGNPLFGGKTALAVNGKLVSNARPPKLPPRDWNHQNRNKNKIDVPKPDYDDEFNHGYSSKTKNDKIENPYYCGFKARVPNFAKRPTQTQLPVQSFKQVPPILNKKENQSRGMIKSVFQRSNSDHLVSDKKLKEQQINDHIDGNGKDFYGFRESIDLFGNNNLVNNNWQSKSASSNSSSSRYIIQHHAARTSSRNGLMNREFIGEWE